MEIINNTYTNQKPIPLNIKGSNMYVIKRDGREEKLQFDKITARIENLCDGLDTNFVNAAGITMKVVNGIHSGCLLYTSPSPRDKRQSRMPSSA